MLLQNGQAVSTSSKYGSSTAIMSECTLKIMRNPAWSVNAGRHAVIY